MADTLYDLYKTNPGFRFNGSGDLEVVSEPQPAEITAAQVEAALIEAARIMAAEEYHPPLVPCGVVQGGPYRSSAFLEPLPPVAKPSWWARLWSKVFR